MPRDLPKNDISMLVLNVINGEPRHGYAIAREIERRSEDTLHLREGSLYPTLRVLEQDGFIVGAWEIQPAGPARKIYTITDAGRAELAKRAEDWHRYAKMINTMLGGLNHARTA